MKNFLEYVATIKGVDKVEMLNRVEEVLKSVNLYHVKEKNQNLFGGG